MKQKKESGCVICGEDECACKKVKVFFCPKCRSFEVGFVFGIKNLMGLLPRMECRNCGFASGIFPQLVVDKNKLDRMNKKRK